MKIHIDNLNSKELEIYNLKSEVQLYRYNEPQAGIFIAESAKIVKRALEKGYEPISLLIDEQMHNPEAVEIIEILENSIPVYMAKPSVLNQITGFNLTRGVLCAMKRRPLMSFHELCCGKNLLAVLEDVENPTNTGSIFRAAAALGIEGIMLTSECTDPLYRRAVRVSMGAVFNIPWTFMDKNDDYISSLKNEGYTVIALALDDKALKLGENALTEVLAKREKVAVILGNEGYGIKPENLKNCDYTVMIPMFHDTDSLNVAAASAVAFWEIKKYL